LRSHRNVREANVVYVIAADRRWISTSFEKAYDTFLSALDEPGRPLGYLFLEKTFQLSAPLPGMSLTLQQKYWDALIRPKGDSASQVQQFEEMEKDISDKVGQEQEKLQGLSEHEIIKELDDGRSDPVQDIALRRAAILQLATPEMNVQTEHFLNQFALFLPPNPRAMKRLVNAYSLARDTLILEQFNNLLLQRKRLVLWTILTLRWPPLAECLSKNPKAVEYIGSTDENRFKMLEVPESNRKLFKDKGVISVVSGKIDEKVNVGVSLDAQTIELLAGEF
jgi:KAP family P-loop domain